MSPARASEFDVSRFYDTRYIHRVVVEETNGDVILSFQLKNAPLAWLVTPQENPWRLVVDIWKTEPIEPRSFEQEWKWQDDATGRVKELTDAQSPQPVNSRPQVVRQVEIDLPDENMTPKVIQAPNKKI